MAELDRPHGGIDPSAAFRLAAEVLAMHNLIPRHTPTLSVLMDDLRLTPRSAARLLQVSERSIYRWMVKDHAPRTVMLSLFFVSRWGISTICNETENAARMYAGLVRCLLEDRRDGSRLFDLAREAANSGQGEPIAWPVEVGSEWS